MKVTMPYDVQIPVAGTDRTMLIEAGTEFEYPDAQAVERAQNPDDHMQAADEADLTALIATLEPVAVDAEVATVTEVVTPDVVVTGGAPDATTAATPTPGTASKAKAATSASDATTAAVAPSTGTPGA